MRRPAQVLCVFFSFGLAVPLAMGGVDESEPCLSHFESGVLSENLYAIGFTANALKLLDGHENPRLKRLLEMNLQFSAANAKRSIDQGARLVSPYQGINTLHPIQEAGTYASDHQLDKMPPVLREKSEATIVENLKAVETWLSKQMKEQAK